MKQNYCMILVFTTLLIVNTGAFAAEKGKLGTYVEPSGEELKSKQGLTVMITVFKGEHPVAQREIGIVNYSKYTCFSNLPTGTYRIRYEGLCLQTIEKQGIVVFPNTTTKLMTFLKEGSGTTAYVYSTTLIPINLTNEEIERRISQLKREIVYLQSHKK